MNNVINNCTAVFGTRLADTIGDDVMWDEVGLEATGSSPLDGKALSMLVRAELDFIRNNDIYTKHNLKQGHHHNGDQAAQ